jgi:hypothetical protein
VFAVELRRFSGRGQARLDNVCDGREGAFVAVERWRRSAFPVFLKGAGVFAAYVDDLHGQAPSASRAYPDPARVVPPLDGEVFFGVGLEKKVAVEF